VWVQGEWVLGRGPEQEREQEQEQAPGLLRQWQVLQLRKVNGRSVE
jgi:hypothetical protein